MLNHQWLGVQHLILLLLAAYADEHTRYNSPFVPCMLQFAF